MINGTINFTCFYVLQRPALIDMLNNILAVSCLYA